jgi:predicted site-specific integrase-resolvase
MIPIWKYAKQKNISVQTIYRWIREGKIPKDKYTIIDKTVKRIVVDENWNPAL